MTAAAQEIWVVLCADDRGQYSTPDNRGEPIVMETPVNGATREAAMQRAAQLEKRYGACRIARLVFEDQPETPK
jgi:hypothetical protein